jgi:sugar lactone lactonase YvrE
VRDRKILRREPGGALVEHADCSAHATGHLNDMVVCGAGRAYAGNFGFDLMGGARLRGADLVRVDPDGSVSVAARGLVFPNGSAITPDGRTLLVAESFANRVSAFSIAEDGSLGPRRDWARLGDPLTTDDTGAAGAAGEIKFIPDGCCLDGEGALWCADAGAQKVVRLREGGEVLEEIPVGTGVFACMLGGTDGKTLYLCCAPDFHEEKRMKATEGCIKAVQVDVGRAGRP